MKKLLIIDGHAMIHRAYHALPPLSTKAGIPTNAIYGFFSMLHIALRDIKPDHLLVAFDTPTPTFRKELLDTYQAKRPAMEENLSKQIDLIKELLDAAHICRVEAPGFEADDVIGTLAKKFAGKEADVYILTGDRDILQLVEPYIKVIMPKIGLSQTVTFDEKAVEEKYFVHPNNFADYKALMGDSSDNYQAIKGIGPKTAVKLVNQFQSVENLYANIDQLADEKLKTKFIENKDTMLLIKKIATIHCDVSVPTTFEDTAIEIPFPTSFLETMKKYEFNALRKRYFPESLEIETPKPEVKTKDVNKKKNDSQMDMF